MSDQEVLLRVQGLTKSFGGALALDGVDLEVLPGEVHGLLGENGSGKSTLIKVLAGYHEPEAGTLYVNGEQVPLPLPPGQARALGMEFVHQDLGLVPSLSVAENLLMGEIAKPTNRFFMPWSRASREVATVFAQYGLDLDPFALVESLRPVERALLAIVRALEGLRKGTDGRPTLLVLDEPTVFLPQHEVALLFDFVRHIANGGSSVLFVSHDLDEVRDITNRVTVLRDGHVAGVVQTAQTSRVELVHLILGHDLKTMEQQVNADRQAGGSVVLQVQDLMTRWLEDVSFELYQGEVLGLTGLVGSGYEDIVYALFGAQPATSGTVRFGERQPVPAAELDPREAMERGLALVPGDRQTTGSLPTLSAAENINLLVLDKYFTSLRLRGRDLMRNAEQLMHTFDVRPARPDLEYGSFSGGNQQKALMAKWQQLEPAVLLLHEPTQGVDVGARQQIWQMIRDTSDVSSTICASSDYEQLAAICDRVGVVARGRLVGYVTGEDLTKESIAAYCLRSSTSAASVVGGFDISGLSDE